MRIHRPAGETHQTRDLMTGIRRIGAPVRTAERWTYLLRSSQLRSHSFSMQRPCRGPAGYHESPRTSTSARSNRNICTFQPCQRHRRCWRSRSDPVPPGRVETHNLLITADMRLTLCSDGATAVVAVAEKLAQEFCDRREERSCILLLSELAMADFVDLVLVGRSDGLRTSTRPCISSVWTSTPAVARRSLSAVSTTSAYSSPGRRSREGRALRGLSATSE
jgi:hypothetical protein